MQPPKQKWPPKKPLRRNIGQKLHDTGFSSDFLDRTSKAQATKEKIAKLHFIKIKTFSASKDNINKVKRQPKEWEKIFAYHI